MSGKTNDKPTTNSKLDKYLYEKLAACLPKFKPFKINSTKFSKKLNYIQTLGFIDIYSDPELDPPLPTNIERILKEFYSNPNHRMNAIIRVLDKKMVHRMQAQFGNTKFDQSSIVLFQINCFI